MRIMIKIEPGDGFRMSSVPPELSVTEGGIIMKEPQFWGYRGLLELRIITQKIILRKVISAKTLNFVKLL